MKRKNISLFFAVIFVLATAGITGCSDSELTSEQLVTPKKETGQNVYAENSQNMGQAADAGDAARKDAEVSAGNEESIAEQVQAPERYQADFSNNGITVHADASIVVPKKEGFQLYTVKGRPFSQEDYDAVKHVLLQDAPLWERDYKTMSGSGGNTKVEIAEFIEEIPSVVPYVKASEGDLAEMEDEFSDEIFMLNQLGGYATVGEEDYWVYLTNDFQSYNHNVQISIQNLKQYYGNNYVVFDENEKIEAFLIKEIREKAVELMEEMGFTDFVLSGEEYYTATMKKGEADEQDIGYGVHFTRSLDGIPVTYTHEIGNSIETDNEAYIMWSYEAVDFVFDGEKMTDFLWRNPYEVERKSEEYVFLMPFSDIQDIFEEMLLEKYKWIMEDRNITLQFTINEVRLGYMRIRDKEGGDEGTMIPVWDFMGCQTVVYTDNEALLNENKSPKEIYTDKDAYQSLLTVNAMDGAVIDRALGY